MIYGWARVSHRDMNLGTQVEKLENYGCDEIVMQKITGVAEHKKLDDLIERMQPGDTLVATRMDRFGRKASQLTQMVDELEKKGIVLVIMDLGVDTKTPTGKFFLQVMAAFAELDRSTLKEKQRAGIELAKKNGIKLGRPKKYGDRHIGLAHAVELYQAGGKTVNEICAITKVSRATFYRHIHEKI
jgi:DNA invertase Pin-like site-specific DNA recombinase